MLFAGTLLSLILSATDVQHVCVQALTRSDSDSSDNYTPDGPPPTLYRLRADGRKVPITEGHGMELARRKGLVQEVVVSPKQSAQSSADPASAFGAQLSQPETVVLHSVELPQVQLGDREMVDSPPEKAGEHPHNGGSLGAQSHPSLPPFQRHREQTATNSLITECGLEPRSHSESVLPSARASPEQNGAKQSPLSQHGLVPEFSQTSEMAGSRSGSVSAAAAPQQPGYAAYWGLTHGSAPLPNQGMPLAPQGIRPFLAPNLGNANLLGLAPGAAFGQPGYAAMHEAMRQVHS